MGNKGKLSTTRRQLVSGGDIDYLDFKGREFTAHEVLANLAKVNRFNGWGISVLDHSYCVAKFLWLATGEPTVALSGLLHDASEAYTGDIPTPMKEVLGINFKRLESKLQAEIVSQLIPHLEGTEDELAHSRFLVKTVDYYAFLAELVYTLGQKDCLHKWDVDPNEAKLVQSLIGMTLCESSDSGSAIIRSHNFYRELISNIKVREPSTAVLGPQRFIRSCYATPSQEHKNLLQEMLTLSTRGDV